MPPSSEPSSQRPSAAPRRLCGIEPHLLQQPTRTITNEPLFRLAKRINPEIRRSQAVCMTCYDKLMTYYRVRMTVARHHEQRPQPNASGSHRQRMDSSSDSSVDVENSPQSDGGVTMRRNLPTVSSPSLPQSSSATSDPRPGTSTSTSAAALPPSSEPSSQETSEATRRLCGIARHRLKQPNRTITNERLFRFAKRINPEIRISQAVCMICYEKMIKIYRVKMAKARRHEQRRQPSDEFPDR